MEAGMKWFSWIMVMPIHLTFKAIAWLIAKF